MQWIWMVGLAACSAPTTKPSDPSDSDDVPSSPADSAAPSDSGSVSNVDTSSPEDTSSPADTAEPDVPSWLNVSGTSVTCENPASREADGPMYLYETDGDWSIQRGQENLWSLYAGQGLAVSDFNNDGRLDVFLPNADADQLFMGTEDGHWSDESEARLPTVTDKASAATPVDVDDDGDVDIFVSIMNAANRLLINDGSGHFSLSSSLWLQSQLRLSQGSTWGDVDGDGDLDVFVSNYTNWSSDWLLEIPTAPTEPAQDSLWLNQGDGEFVNADDRLVGFDSASAFTFTAGFWDQDDDADLDLIVINDYRSEYSWTQPVQFFENEGGHFTSTGESLGLEFPAQGMGLGAAELNGDGMIDFVIQANSTFLMLSDATFVYYEASVSRGIFRQPGQDVGWGAELADMNNDGRADFSVAYGFLPPDEVSMEAMPNPIVSAYVDGIRVEQPNSLYLQTTDGKFEDVAPLWGLDDRGVSRGFVLADVNRDGFLDWMGRDLRGPTRLYLSRCNEKSWLTVRLVQPAPNRDAVGAKITLISGDQRWSRWVHRGSTNMATGGPSEVHFGLDDVDVIDRMEIRWPNGETDRILNVDARQHLLVEHYGR